jgi:CheY-like chemotaxis protein
VKGTILDTSQDVRGVIIADDDLVVRGILQSAFQAIGQTVFLANNGLEAVDLASRFVATLILLDLRMPTLNGLLACERIRRLPDNSLTPIMILTSASGSDVKTASARVGATGFLSKPFSWAPLLMEISRFLPINDLTLKAIRRDAARAAEIARTAPAPISGKAPTPDIYGNPLDRDMNILATLRGLRSASNGRSA